MPDTALNILRGAGYAFHHDRKMDKDSFVRRLGNGFYPRFHLYVDDSRSDRVVFDLHLDQKQASYKGSHMHSAEYEGELVSAEISRLKSYILSLLKRG